MPIHKKKSPSAQRLARGSSVHKKPLEALPRPSFARPRSLLSPPGPLLLQTLHDVLNATASACPLPSSHRSELPFAIRDLSRILTEERGALARTYWAAPRLFAAYLHFFLPWNLYRLSWLLPGLTLPLRPDSLLLDLGSGPLTLPLALWCARPDLRGTPLRFVCNDLALQPMQSGKAIFQALAGKDSPWRIHLMRGPLEKALHPFENKGFDCILSGNVLNELANERPGSAKSSLEQRLDALLHMASGCLVPGGHLLLLEPGTRLGGKVISLFRNSALRRSFRILAPCTHDCPCPMLPRAESEAPPSGFSGWCHFSHPATDAPAPLTELSQQAKLQKHSLALSCLLLQAPERNAAFAASSAAPEEAAPFSRARKNVPPGPYETDSLEELEVLYAEIMDEPFEKNALPGGPTAPAKSAYSRHKAETAQACAHTALRVISGPIALPGHAEPARYACCEKGLALLTNARRTPSGALIMVPLPAHAQRDRKSGALLVSPDGGDCRPTSAPVRHKDEAPSKKGGRR